VGNAAMGHLKCAQQKIPAEATLRAALATSTRIAIESWLLQIKLRFCVKLIDFAPA
jgi:hypothetical protein